MTATKSFRMYWPLQNWTQVLRGTTIENAMENAGYNPAALTADHIFVEGEEEKFEYDAATNSYVDNSKSHRWDEATRAWIKIDPAAEAEERPTSPGIAEQVDARTDAIARIIFAAITSGSASAWQDSLNAARTIQAASLPSWRDIASAPLDGTPVDLWRDGERLIEFHWNVDQRRWEKKVGYPAKTIVLTQAPTHWMPVPPAAV
ncbi:hypothetical protein [Bosea massiliensis]|uniref:DUF551 domain-containing protein n=1 Tax=Bosea massiliensis TaxID=151419 RepID=A0ABW0NXU0_9HYPH